MVKTHLLLSMLKTKKTQKTKKNRIYLKSYVTS